MKPEEYSEREMELEGWPVKITTYRLDSEYHCTIDNVSPGAWIARTTGQTRQEAEQKAISKAREKLARTRRQIV